MKKQNTLKAILIFTLIFGSFFCNAQTRKDGRPDMRYKVNKQLYGNTYSSPSYSNSSYSYPSSSYSTPTYSTPTYSTPSYNTPTYTKPRRNYSNGGSVYMQSGYYKRNGTYVQPHYKTRSDNYQYNNLNNWNR